MTTSKKNIVSDSEIAFNNLPFLPPNKDKIETVKVLRQLVKSSVALAELKGIVHMLIGIIFTFLLIASSVFALFYMTNVNEWDEIKNNNIVIALISGAIIIGLSVIMDNYVGNLCEAIVPYPEVFNVH